MLTVVSFSFHNLSYIADNNNEINKESHHDTVPATGSPVVGVQTFEECH